MPGIKMTPEVKAAVFIHGQAVTQAMEDEGLDQETRERLAARINAMFASAIDREYTHVATVALQ